MSTSHAFDASGAPPLSLLATEPFRAALDFFTAKLGQPPKVRGDGHPVVIYPGLGAGAMTTSQLRGYLRACNFAVSDWGLGMNRGPDSPMEAWLGSLVERVRALHAEHGRKASLIGWSLGGIYAREVAKQCPESVRQVITLATPFRSIGDGNHAGAMFRMLGGSTSQLTPELQAHLRGRPPVPVTSIYSRSDGMVNWRGCLEEPGAEVENVEVDASHLGMATHAGVMRVVADRLAQPEGDWRPYRAA
ncbi:MAG: alpha/beta hydrolase [Comamonadaceae bacterium]|nr:MAG: alpha/beta hydrolase [Comamonadaceae bacterium]